MKRLKPQPAKPDVRGRGAAPARAFLSGLGSLVGWRYRLAGAGLLSLMYMEKVCYVILYLILKMLLVIQEFHHAVGAGRCWTLTRKLYHFSDRRLSNYQCQDVSSELRVQVSHSEAKRATTGNPAGPLTPYQDELERLHPAIVQQVRGQGVEVVVVGFGVWLATSARVMACVDDFQAYP
ncbi:hypothetical protein VOLCADRAFT_97725 [Volvox carteri f. nagariensis]|uniref:Uncharacterized protein n=1 Tax=Volvox carteri f. nagariensis TaxID=3068 RepID=D8UDH3_VOLCA|nr:uncharacterized protein VOLCADRAFT_97725 [Volvox carteri f. nagariensis]EFJ42264.1 hypothetical protein VOLCADRAFT_97725 [Volvox carteri f. nagariensis]|eukprot:XP_002956662.1 hypothetical protein VOLCADRAFT_97725 [Volvox carteri f. nagariensis]